jgi:signal transduction histidine kinase
LVVLGLLGAALVGWFLWAAANTEPPSFPVLVADLVAVVGLAVGPWLIFTLRRLHDEPEARTVLWRVVLHSGLVAAMGLALGLGFVLVFGDEPHLSVALPGFSLLVAGVVALIGAVILPWVFVLVRTVSQERAARVRAEEGADVAAHLHDTVLQALTIIQKRSDDPQAILRLARSTERKLRAWLYGAPAAGSDDFAAAVTSVAEEVEDLFGVTVELGVVGTCQLDARAQAVVGAIREALTNAAKHAGVRHVSVYTEVADDELLALVRDRGRGFDPVLHSRPGGRGIADSIEGRLQQHGGTATIRSTTGGGTEVELRAPLAAVGIDER